MNINTLFTPSGFQSALKAYHKHLNQKYNFPALSGVKPIHRFAEVFSYPSAEPFIQKLSDLNAPSSVASPSNMFILIHATQSAEVSLQTTLHHTYEDALSELREEVKNNIEILSSEEEILENFSFDSDNATDLDSLLDDADENTLREIFQFLHESDAIATIRKQYVKQYVKPEPETSVSCDNAVSPVKTNYDLLLSDAALDTVNIETALSKPFDWHVRNDSGEYIDLEVEYTYAKETHAHDRLSFNLVVSFNREEKEASFSFGDNKGDGLNEHMWGNFSDRYSLAENLKLAMDTMKNHNTESHRDFIKTVNLHSDVFRDIITAAKAMDTFIGIKI